MAEAVFRSLASQRLDCSVDQLRENGVDVFSAGVAAPDSAPASPEAIEVLREQGIELTNHLSQQVTDEMLSQSDLVITMTAGHLGILTSARPDIAGRMRTLRADGSGISDPIGGGIDEYRHCVKEITRCLEPILDDILRKDTAGT